MTVWDAAHAYAEVGMRVLPLHSVDDHGYCSCGDIACNSPGKHPRTQHGVDDATTDASLLAKWQSAYPTSNLGIATGDGLLVVDVDERHGGKNAFALISALHDLPDTHRVNTGNGFHLYFACQNGVRGSKLMEGIDVKGQGGYVVAPPSVHVSGVSYEVANDLPLAQAPKWLLDSLYAKTDLKELPEQVDEGQRSNALTSLAGTLFNRGVRGEALLQMLSAFNATACNPPLLDEEVEQIAASALRNFNAKGETLFIDGAPRDRQHPGGDFILDTPKKVPTVWGMNSQIAWAQGEGLMIVGPQGVGKTTVMQQVVLARVGVTDSLFGMPVEPEHRRVLYIAADRPAQARRSFARMVGEDDRDLLNQHLVIWEGPLPFDLVREPAQRFCEWCLERMDGPGTIAIDSLKDIAISLSEDEVGAKVNIAIQHCLASGIEAVTAHHQRKAQANNRKPNTLSDVFGSNWLTAGMGSVLLLWGAPGDPIVELSHLKQPVESVGPLELIHDHERGETRAEGGAFDLRILLQTTGRVGLTVKAAAQFLFSTDEPTRNEKEKARRKLDTEVSDGRATREEAKRSDGQGGKKEVAYYPSENRITDESRGGSA